MLRTSHQDRRSVRPLTLQPGEVITGNVVNGLENRRASGKVRLVVVVDPTPQGHVLVAGLTSKALTARGEQRDELLDNSPWGWLGRSYIYGQRLTRLSRIDVGSHVGWVSERDADTLARVFGLDHDWSELCGEAA